ncbi:MAG: DNA internalization-related competence protein ComEC/Rec2 [Syntrophales bacterium]|jgi:competence protein ComEC|nr:DNA internalization-related competence protein ComEC/Rec2 [Syntrophales bacterium]MCK9527459.1 DNA internalization-related competence protein ComEC/Rec2 [Syntrophales bacterium]MDX9921563.1 DNA internalization-related competence protein ComEC/Rec2 [Syntrophales bacterium]
MKIPLAALCVPFMAGIALGSRLPLPETLGLVQVLAACVAILAALRRGNHRIILVCLVFAWFFTGFLAGQGIRNPEEKPDTKTLLLLTEQGGNKKSTLEGYIAAPPHVMDGKTRVILSVTARVDEDGRHPQRGTVLLTVRNSPEDFAYGDYLRFTARLKKPENFRNPGGFDYQRYLSLRGMSIVASVSRATDIVLLRRGGGNPVKAAIEHIRGDVRTLIARATGPPARELLGALILGEKERIPPALREGFNRTGVAHILAISGLHIGMAAFFAFVLIRLIMTSWSPLLLKANLLKVCACGSLLFVLNYAFIAGFSISTVRATLMISLLAVSLLFSRTATPLNTLSLTALAVLTLSPAALFDVSFQLSFAAVAAILLVMPRALPAFRRLDNRRFLKAVVVSLVVTTTSTIGTAPLIVLYFNRLSLVTLLSNALVVPLVGFAVLPPGIAAAFLAPFLPWLSVALFKAASLFLTPLLWIIRFLEGLPWSSMDLPSPGIPAVVCFYAVLLLVLKLFDAVRAGPSWRSAGRQSLPTMAAMITIAAIGLGHELHLVRTGIPSNRLEMTCLDVGQGDSALVTFPDKTVMLVDGGGFFDSTFDVGKNVVAPYLHHRRIRTIDVVVLTHPDHDHIGGLPYILEAFRVREVWSNGDEADSESYRRFSRAIEKKGIQHRVLWSGSPDRLMGGALISVINPREKSRKRIDFPAGYDYNRYSLVLKITWGAVSFLLTGDITGEQEIFLIKDGAGLKSTVMQVPHHGSALSSRADFLETLGADIAVVSAGRDNIFGFPRPEVIERYREAGTTLYRTDLNGAVTVGTDGDVVDVSCFIPCAPAADLD